MPVSCKLWLIAPKSEQKLKREHARAANLEVGQLADLKISIQRSKVWSCCFVIGITIGLTYHDLNSRFRSNTEIGFSTTNGSIRSACNVAHSIHALYSGC